MKKTILTKVLSAALIVTSLSSALMPKAAHAGICYYFTHADTSTEEKWERVHKQKLFVFFGLLPVGALTAVTGPVISGILNLAIFLDQKVDQVPQLTENDLLNNGYSAEETAQIVSDETRFSTALQTKQALIGLESGDSASEARRLIKEIYPQASDLYLDLKSEQMSLAAQAISK